MAMAGVVEHTMGRVVSASSHVYFWVGSVTSSELSQQIADWYSFSHLIHGMALYGLFHLLSRKTGASIRTNLLLTTVVEACWEMLEIRRSSSTATGRPPLPGTPETALLIQCQTLAFA